MRRLILFLLLSFTFLTTYSQNKRYLCEIKGIEKDFTSGLKIVFDFGNNPVYSIWGSLKNTQKLVDENGEEIPFNSMVDAGNYMLGKGWTFLQAYSSDYGSNPIIHWIFYKDAASPEEAVEGLMTKDTYKKQQKK